MEWFWDFNWGFFKIEKVFSELNDLLKEYADENGIEDKDDVDNVEFTEDYFYNNAEELYLKIDNDIREELIATTAGTAEDWFDEEEEGCSIEEYLENNYDFGFHFTEEFLASIF